MSDRAACATGLRVFRAGWTVFVVLATTVPYGLNLMVAPSGSHYTWIVPPYPEDSLAYRAWSQQAAHGSLLFQLKYTALPHAAFLFQPLFLICGWISAVFHCDIGIVHLVVKAVGVVLFLAHEKGGEALQVTAIDFLEVALGARLLKLFQSHPVGLIGFHLPAR